MFFITCFQKIEKDERGRLRVGAERTFGFRETLALVEEALNNNICDMHEYLYNYAVVEEMGPYIHPDVEQEVWFQWDCERKGFFRIEKPPETYGVCNFAFG